MLLAERASADARVLVLGAGGGLELKAFAEIQPEWRFDGVDPSAEMLQLARTNLGLHVSRVEFHEGYIDSAPDGPFDAAACLLTLHFPPQDERRQTVREVYRRLKPGAPFVVAHHSFPNQGSDKDKWLARNAAFAVASGVPASQAERSITTMKEQLPVLSPDRDEGLLRGLGFPASSCSMPRSPSEAGSAIGPEARSCRTVSRRDVLVPACGHNQELPEKQMGYTSL